MADESPTDTQSHLAPHSDELRPWQANQAQASERLAVSNDDRVYEEAMPDEKGGPKWCSEHKKHRRSLPKFVQPPANQHENELMVVKETSRLHYHR